MIEAKHLGDPSHLRVVPSTDFQESPLTFPVWRRQDAELARVFEVTRSVLASGAEGATDVPLEVPDRYMPFALRLVDGWGSEDKGKPVAVGMMEHPSYQTVYAHDLYEGGVGNQHVATVLPNAISRFETVRVRSVEAASKVCNILYEARLREEAELERLRVEAIEKAANPVVKSEGFKPKAIATSDEGPFVWRNGHLATSNVEGLIEDFNILVIKGEPEGMVEHLEEILKKE